MTATVHRRESQVDRRTIRRSIAAETAAEALGPLEHGCEIFGLTMGQFSLVDIVAHVLRATGPADVAISTWTAAGADMGFAMALLANGSIRSLRFVVDFSFPRRQPAYCDAMRQRFGDDAVRITKTHAKFVLVTNDEWAIVIRSSMNLNENRRLESFEISDDRGMAEHLAEVVDALWAEHAPGTQFAQTPGKNVRDFEHLAQLGASPDYFGNGPLAQDVRRAGWSTAKGGKL